MNESDAVRPSTWTDLVLLYDDGNVSVVSGLYDGGASPVYGLCRGHDIDNADAQRTEDTLAKSDWLVLPPFLVGPMLQTLLVESLKHPRLQRFHPNILRAIRRESKRVCPNSLQYAIALYGASNTGKTMTLNILIDLLEAEGKKIEHGGIVSVLSNGYNPATGNGDRCVAIRVFGKLVVVATSGDNAESVQQGIDFAFRCNADILVSATRKRADSKSWGAFSKAIGEMADIVHDGIEKIWVSNPEEAQSQAQKQAEDLFNRIRLA